MLLGQLEIFPKFWDFTTQFCHSLHSKNHLRMEDREIFYRVCTDHEKHGKSWNLFFQFPGLESRGI